jgi:hypothetical protein
MLITNEEATKSKPSGWDVFKKTHLMYMDGINRDAAVAELNYEAYKAFADTILMQQSAELIAEQNRADEFIKSGKRLGVDDYPWPHAQFLFGRFRNYEYLKIGCGFELSLKSQLLGGGYVVHEIDGQDSRYSKIAIEQKDRPIRIDEIMAVSGYMYNGTHNILPGIRGNSMKFSTILGKVNYRKAYLLDSKTLDVIFDYKDLRNAIHLPGDPVETKEIKGMSWSKRIEFLRRYIYEQLVLVNRSIVEKHGLPKILEIKDFRI